MNDIIEIEIVSKNKAVKIGSSSDCDAGDSRFFDKLYFIEKDTFEDVRDFRSKLLPYSINGKISVRLIDGIAPKQEKVRERPQK